MIELGFVRQKIVIVFVCEVDAACVGYEGSVVNRFLSWVELASCGGISVEG